MAAFKGYITQEALEEFYKKDTERLNAPAAMEALRLEQQNKVKLIAEQAKLNGLNSLTEEDREELEKSVKNLFLTEDELKTIKNDDKKKEVISESQPSTGRAGTPVLFKIRILKKKQLVS